MRQEMNANIQEADRDVEQATAKVIDKDCDPEDRDT